MRERFLTRESLATGYSPLCIFFFLTGKWRLNPLATPRVMLHPLRRTECARICVRLREPGRPTYRDTQQYICHEISQICNPHRQIASVSSARFPHLRGQKDAAAATRDGYEFRIVCAGNRVSRFSVSRREFDRKVSACARGDFGCFMQHGPFTPRRFKGASRLIGHIVAFFSATCQLRAPLKSRNWRRTKWSIGCGILGSSWWWF